MCRSPRGASLMRYRGLRSPISIQRSQPQPSDCYTMSFIPMPAPTHRVCISPTTMSDPLLSVPDKTVDEHQDFHPHRDASAWTTSQPEVYLCIILHTLLVLAHVALVVVIAHHYEHRVTAETGDHATRLSTIVTVVTQTIGTVYSAVLVLLTQRLALKREFYVRQALSALHDKSTAWSGIGSSFLTLWGQLRVRTAPVRLFMIASYLAGIFVFHITTPSLFNVAPYNVTTLVKQTTAQSRVIPNISSAVITGGLFPESIYSILEVLPLYPDLDTPGLLNSTLYDVVPLLDDATGEVIVSAAQFEVDCGAVRGGYINDIASINGGEESLYEWANVSVGVPGVVLNLISAANPSLVVTSAVYNSSANYPFVIVTATVNVTDDSGTMQSVHSINPWAIKATNDSSILYATTQLLACNVDLKNATVNVSAKTGKLLREPFTQPQAAWHDWQLPEPSDDPMLSGVSIRAYISHKKRG
ncbi:hypothetical protein PHLGIDRAFT_302484 [Phlebiopsis gigantea 11061_1 CR5-6]|uniref:Uncharacterized protein n=1 Tax=Phlebiopsis gigantea (strain 11061_1 CR5-6) TaxID=745531 RepID=A0A0C3S2Y2_PHLG1|nr:hypothetical protein PHLGIDRAFT_302484 [Phlebiopsis gigantea 11061_1 CR5-6]